MTLNAFFWRSHRLYCVSISTRIIKFEVPSEAELQELVDSLDRVSGINTAWPIISVDKTKVMESDGIACRVFMQNEQLELQVDTFTYLGSLITEDGECTTEFRNRLKRGQVIGTSPQKLWKSHSIPISTKIRLMKAQGGL